MAIAVHLRTPTLSLRTNAPKIVTKKGATKLTATASAIGTTDIANINIRAEAAAKQPRKTCR
jgi:hypothetical protein